MAGAFIDDDLVTLFDEDEFADTATLNGTASGNVIVDREYLRAVDMVSSNDPVALAMAADYDEDCVSGTLAAGGGTYVIRDRQPQDDGRLVLLQLEEV